MIGDEGYKAAKEIAKALSEIADLNVTPYMRDLTTGETDTIEGSIHIDTVKDSRTSARDGRQEVCWELDLVVPSGFTSTSDDAEGQAEAKICELASYDPDKSIFGRLRGREIDIPGTEKSFFVQLDSEGFTRGIRLGDNDSIREHVITIKLEATI